MAATTLKARTNITQFEEKDLSLGAIEVLPDLLQTRAKIDPGFVLAYAKAMSDGSIFPPVIVYRDDTGRMYLADGFHRFEARKKLGLRTIKAVIRDGSMQDALLAGIEANFDPYHSRKVEEVDRRHAVEILVRNGAGDPGRGTWDWPDSQIGVRCGVGAQIVRRVRLELANAQSIPMPSLVQVFTAGAPSGLTRKARSAPRATVSVTPGSLGRPKLDGSSASRQEKTLEFPADLASWLLGRDIVTRPSESAFGGLAMREGVVLIALPVDSTDALYRVIGRAVLIRASMDCLARIVVVGYHGSFRGPGGQAIRLARLLPQPIEFMTPEEVVAEFGPRDGEVNPAPASPLAE